MLTASRTETLCLRFQRTVEDFTGEVALPTPGGEVELTWAEDGQVFLRGARVMAGYSATIDAMYESSAA